MSDLKPQGISLVLDKKEYKLYFDLNVIDDIQEKFDIPIEQMFDILNDNKRVYKALKFILATLINEGIDYFETGEKHVTERQIGRLLTPANLKEAGSKVLKAFSAGTPESEEESPNAMSE